MAQCTNCGAPISAGTCRYCGTEVEGPKPEMRTIRSNASDYDVLRNVKLIGNSNSIGEAHNCVIVGNANDVAWADASTTVEGNSNDVGFSRKAPPSSAKHIPIEGSRLLVSWVGFFILGLLVGLLIGALS